MIERRFGKLLSRYEKEECKHKNKDTNTKVAVLLETREAYFLPHVIKNVCEKLGEDWNLHLFVNESVLSFLRKELPECEYKTTLLLERKLRIEDYSFILRSKDFWETIKEDKVLIFQTDTYLFSRVPEWVLEYDFIGAVCGNIKSVNEFVCNGGLSVRSKKAMLECSLDREANKKETRPEDVYFSEVMLGKGKYWLPNVYKADQFASESVYARNCVGVHGTDKFYY